MLGAKDCFGVAIISLERVVVNYKGKRPNLENE